MFIHALRDGIFKPCTVAAGRGSMVMSPDVRYAISDISANNLNLISLSARSQTGDGVNATWACMHETRGCLLTLGIGSASFVHSWLLPDISAAFGRNEYSRGVYVRCYLWLQLDPSRCKRIRPCRDLEACRGAVLGSTSAFQGPSIQDKSATTPTSGAGAISRSADHRMHSIPSSRLFLYPYLWPNTRRASGIFQDEGFLSVW